MSPGPVRCCGCFAPQPVIGGLRRHRAVLRLVRGALARSRHAASGSGRPVTPAPGLLGCRRVHGWARLCGAEGIHLNLRREEAEAGARVLLTARRRFPEAGDSHPGSGEPAASSADLMRECADGACTPPPGGRWRRPGPQQGPGRSDPVPRASRGVRFTKRPTTSTRLPPKSVQPGEDGPGCLHAEGRDRAEARAGTLVRPCGATFPQGRPDDHG